jgi:hypothetical protein
MVKMAAVIALTLGIVVVHVGAKGHDSLVRFEGGIGVIPVSSAAGTANADGTFPNVNKNVVRGVNPPVQIWRIGDLDADVDFDGHIKVRGRGLLLGGGNGIGGNANQSVIATLICEATAPFTLHSTLTGVPLEPNGDFRIDDTLVPSPPLVCASPVLLIRNTGGSWFAAGFETRNDDQTVSWNYYQPRRCRGRRTRTQRGQVVLLRVQPLGRLVSLNRDRPLVLGREVSTSSVGFSLYGAAGPRRSEDLRISAKSTIRHPRTEA